MKIPCKASLQENVQLSNYVAEKKWRNSVFRGNSSGLFLHGPPLNSWLKATNSPHANAGNCNSTRPTIVTYVADTGQRYTLVSHALLGRNKEHGFSMLHGVRTDHKT